MKMLHVTLVCIYFLPLICPAQKSFIDTDNKLLVDLTGKPYSLNPIFLINHEILRAAGEQSINEDFSENNQIVRVSLSPTFGKPIVLRMYRHNDSYFISIRRFSGNGGYELGHVELIGEVRISDKIFHEVLNIAKNISVLNLANLSKEQRLQTASIDGTWWSVEIKTESKLSIIDFHSPQPIKEDATGISPFLTAEAVEKLINLVDKLFFFSSMKRPE